jgi:hypothetical protein
VSKPLEIVVGRGQQYDPAVGDTAYNNPNLAGQDLWVELVGTGFYPYENYTVLSTGGFSLNGGTKFGNAGQTWAIHPQQFVPGVSPVTGLTNGYNIAKVMGALQGRLGWSQPTVAGTPTISGQNQTATSSRYYEDFHPASSIQRLYQAQPDRAITDANFNNLLQQLDRSVIMRCLNAVFNRPQKIDHGLVYERMSNVRSISIPNTGNFCGYRIKVSNGNYAVMLNALALYFNGVATFNVYLFNDLTKAPLLSQSVTTVANSQTVVTLNWILKYVDNNKGGLFYVGYFQDDLGAVTAIDEQLNMWTDAKIYGAYPFQSVRVPGQLDFNRINPSVVFKTYGMNMELSSYRDFTEVILQNAHLFDEARGLAMAIRVIQEIKNSVANNPTTRISNEMIKLDYDVDLAFPTKDAPFMSGLKAQVARELERISCNFFPKKEPTNVSVAGSYDRDEFAYDTFDIRNLPPRERFF